VSSTQTNRKTGFRAITSLVKNTRKSTLEKGYIARSMKLAQDEVFPIHCLDIHVVILSTRSVFMAFTTFCSQLALRFGVSQNRTTIHNHAQSPSAADDALRDLQNHGFTVEGIPAVPFGGMFTIGCFREWLEDRHRLERHLHDPNVTADGAASSTASDTADLHDTETRKRRADASYCRKKRYLKRIEVVVMQEEVERLRHQNGRLKEEEARLEQCLVRAQSEVEAHRQHQSRITTSLPSLGDHERAAAVHGSILRALSAPCSVSSGQVALNQRFPFPDPRLLGRNIPSLGWSDPHGSLGPATQSNTPLGAPVQARPNLYVPPRHYADHLLRLQLRPPPTAATDPLLSRAQTLHAQYPLQTMHLDRNRLQLSNERTDPHDLQQLLVERFLREAFPSLRRSRDA
jgi:transposase-like protein